MIAHIRNSKEIPLNANMNYGIITLREGSSEKYSITYGKNYEENCPGSSWIKAFCQKNKSINYEVSQDIYVASIVLVYQNFGNSLDRIR